MYFKLQSSLHLPPLSIYTFSPVALTAAISSILSSTNMADFDAIYEDQDENSSILEAPNISLTPDPVVIRGAVNIRVVGL